MSVAAFKKVSEVHQELRDLLQSGKWKVGERLPREVVLAERFGCSLGTMNKAMGLLAHEGFIERKARVGTHVLDHTKPDVAAESELHSVAFIYPSDQHEGIWRNLRGFQEVANQKRQRVLMLSTNADYRKEFEFLKSLPEMNVRGAVIFPDVATPEMQVDFSRLIVETKMPLVLLSVNLMGLGRPTVVLDNIHAGYAMTRHLINKGARQIGFFSNRASSMAMRDRYQGYCRAMEEAALPVVAGNVMLNGSMVSDFADPLAEPIALARTYLSTVRKLDGVVCATDYLGYGMLAAAKEAGLSVPSALKVVGIDGYYMPDTPDEVRLTTYRSPCEEIGRIAFETLQRIINGEDVPPGEILIRGSIVEYSSS